MEKKKICLVEDDHELLEATAKILSANFEVISFSTATEALAAIDSWRDADVVLCDLHLPKMDGLTFTEQVRQQKVTASVVLMSGYADKDAAIRALDVGIHKIIEKPFDRDQILEAIQKAAELTRAAAMAALHHSRLASLHENLGEVISERLQLAEDSAHDQNVNLFNHQGIRAKYVKSLAEERQLREAINAQESTPISSEVQQIKDVPKLVKKTG